MILNCVIVDDEPMARKLLQEYIEETDFLKLCGATENPVKAIGLINSAQTDLLFLDINMPKMSGMEFLRSSANLPMVIMTTAYGQYALEGFEMAVIDYLVKPFSLERFIKASQKALELKMLKQKSLPAQQSGTDFFFVKCEGKIVRVVHEELLYVEALANYVILYTLTGKFIVYLTIKGILEKLPVEKFLRVHKSYLVNADKINSIEGNMIHTGSHRIPLGAGYYDDAVKNILKDRFIKR